METLSRLFGKNFGLVCSAPTICNQLTFRDIFTSIPHFWRLIMTVCEFILESNSTGQEDSVILEAA